MFRLIRVLFPQVILGSLLATASTSSAMPLFPSHMSHAAAFRMHMGPAAMPRGLVPGSPFIGFPHHRVPFLRAQRFVPFSSLNMSFTTTSGSVSPAWYTGGNYGGGYGGGSYAPTSSPPPAAPLTSVRSAPPSGSLDLLNWPTALKVLGPAPEAQTLRQEIDTKVQQLKNQAESGAVDQDLLKQTRRDVERLRQLLTDSRGKLALTAITEGQQFLDKLVEALKQLSA